MAVTVESIKKDYPWLTRDFFQNIFREKLHNSKLEIVNHEVVPALAPGENYASVVVRGNFELKNCEQKNFHVVTKLSHVRPDIEELMQEFNIFERETSFYKTVLNKVHETLKSVGIHERLAADLISDSSKPCYVMFEDLKQIGFRLADKRKGLCVDHLKITLNKLAYWHATTATLEAKNPTMMDPFRESLFSAKNNPMMDSLINVFVALADEVKQWPGFSEIGSKLDQVVLKFMERAEEVYVFDDKAFNVLTHGDLWLCNIMYKYDEETGKVIDVIPVDYSVGYWGSPGLDLCYIFFSSSADNVTEQDWDRLLAYYHSRLIDTLKKLNYPKKLPSLFDIQIYYLKASRFLFTICTMIAGIRHLPVAEKGTLANMIDDSEAGREFRKMLFASEGFRKPAEKLLDYYNRKGLLD